jgi:16S rRNA G966 N2-methylase RsmD
MFIFNLKKVKNGENKCISANKDRSIESKAKCRAGLIFLDLPYQQGP